LNASNISDGTLAVSHGGIGTTTLTAGQLLIGNDTALLQTPNLTWNTATNMLGIGKTNPGTTLDVSGTVTATLFSGSGASLTGFTEDQIPALPQSKITGLDTSLNAKQNLINNITAGQVILGNGTTGIQSTPNLVWDTATNMLGIGKTNPGTTLDVSGTVTATLFSGSGASLTGFTETQIPSLPQSKITGLDTSLNAKQNLINNITAGQVILGNGTTGIQSTPNLVWDTATNMLGIGKTNPNYVLDVSGGDVYFNGTIYAGADIVAYFSDNRLKTKIENINNPLNIINELNGFKYIPNKKANELGINNNNIEIGLSAQDVKKVLPELVTLAPFDRQEIDGKVSSKSGENYLTVKYDKLIPILIEGIKDLNNIIKLQSEKINILEAKIELIEKQIPMQI
jgi:hypothetical protein